MVLRVAILCAIMVGAMFPGEAVAAEVVFNGVPPDNSNTIARLVKRVGLDSVTVDSVTTLLINNGYLDGHAEAENGRLVVYAGARYKLDRVFLTGDTTFEFSVGSDFKRRSLERAIDKALESFYDSGYFFASARLEKVHCMANQVRPEFRLSLGPLVSVSGTRYTGLKRTRAEMLDRYLSVQVGDRLTGRKIRDAEKAAAAIPFVDFRPPVRVRPREGYSTADLEFEFAEKKQFRFEGGGGYMPGDAAGLVWSLNVRFVNLFGRGREVALQSDRRERGRNLLHVSYRQPVFLFGVGSMHLQATTRDYREEFSEFAVAGEYTTFLKPEMSVGLMLEWKSVVPVSELLAYDRFTSRVSINRVTLDNPINPTRGVSLTWSIAYSYRRYKEDSLAAGPERQTFNETRTSLTTDWYLPVGGPGVVHLGLNYTGLETDESLPPLSELTFVGGPGTMRGFRNEQFAALRTAYGTFEPRLRFHDGYLFGFYDGAYLNNRVPDGNNSAHTDELFRFGYGLGVALMDETRSVRISFGWNPELKFDEGRLSVEFSSGI